jgi:hypothetical protein
MEIEKIIHRIWIQGFQHLPNKFLECDNSVRKVKGYEKKNWDDESIRKLLVEGYPAMSKIYSSTESFEQKADIARVAIMHSHGGIYLDVDIEIIGDINTLIVPGKELLFMRSPVDFFDRYTLQNCFLASTRLHPFWKEVMDSLLERNKETTKEPSGMFTGFKKWKEVINTTGSKLVLDCVNKYPKKKVTHFLTWPKVTFLFSNRGDYLLEGPTKETVLVVKQNLATRNDTFLYKVAIIYSKVRKYRFPILLITLLVFLILLFS